MNAGELVELFRDEMNDLEEPYLWSDRLVYGYADDAQKMFCRLTDGINDATNPAVTRVNVTPTTTNVAISPLIKKIRTARRMDDGRPIEVLNHEDMAPRGWLFDGRKGQVRALIIGMKANQARVYPDSNESVLLDLMVFRLPLDPITAADNEFEIDEQHHRHLLLWMKSLAYGKQDAETFDKSKKAEFDDDFRLYCKQVEDEQRRARHKTRVVAYGGIPMDSSSDDRYGRGRY